MARKQPFTTLNLSQLTPGKKSWLTRRANAQAAGKPKPKRRPAPPQEPIALPKPVRPASAVEMMARTVVLVLTVNGIGNRRKVNTSQIEVDADKTMLGVTKKLYDSEELDEIVSVGNKARMWVETLALPSNIKKGVYLLPVEFVETVDEKLEQFNEERRPLVGMLISRLADLEAESRTRLKGLYDKSQYPTADELRAAFRISWRYLAVDSAKNLEQISTEIYAKECKKAEAAWAETRETIKNVLRNTMSELINHMVDRLTPESNGDKKMFKQGSIERLNNFLSTFEPRNITNDVQLQVLVSKAKSILKDTNADTLRSDEEMREYVLHGFQTIKTVLDPMIIDQPIRAIRVEE